jgi:hypothetical protein
MNPYCVPKFIEYFLGIFKGMSGTQIWKQIFERTMENNTFKKAFIDQSEGDSNIGNNDSAIHFINFFHQWFEKHSMSESTPEFMQHYHIQMKTEPS